MLVLVIVLLLVVVGIGLVVAFRSSDGSSSSSGPSGRPCPACDGVLPRDGSSRRQHLETHTRRITQDGQIGYLWQCGSLCGHSDRFWSSPSDAAIAMTAHLMDRHAILPA